VTGTRGRRGSVVALVAVLALLVSACGVLTHAGDPTRLAWYRGEPNLTPQLVGGGTFGQMFSAAVDGQVYAQPVVVNGTVIVATERNWIYGIDATTGARQWGRNVGVPWNPNDVACSDLTPSIGITGTPVVDGASGTAYFFAKTYASGTSGPAVWWAHAVDANNGAERPGFPVAITGTASNQPGKQFLPTMELQRPGLLLLDGVVYAGFGGHCDRQPYSGWVVGVSTAGAITTLWTSSPGDRGAAGIWHSGGGLMSDGPGSIYIATGNGSADVTARPGSSPGASLGQAVVHLRVQPDRSLKAVDFFAPYDADTLDDADADLASGSPVLLPANPFSTPAHPRLVAIAGKQGYVYLLDADDLGGMRQGPTGGDRIVARVGPLGGVWGQLAAWPGDGGYLYVQPSYAGGVVRVLKFGVDGAGTPTLAEVATSAEVSGFASTAAVVSSDGTTPGTALLWVMSRAANGDGQLRAYDAVPVNGRLVLRWSGSLGQATKFSIPVVSGSRVYVGTADGRLLSFGSPVTQPLTGGPLTLAGTAVGQARTADLTLTATTGLTISGITSSDPAFVPGTPRTSTTPPQTTPPLLLATGDRVTIPVTFRPTAPGAQGAELRLATSVRTVTIPMSAVGINPTGLLEATPPVLSFGGAAANGPPVNLSVAVTNVGATPVVINGIDPPAAPFAATGLPAVGASIAAGATVVIGGSFTPTTIGQYADDLTLATSAGPLEIPFSGASAPPPVMTITASPVAFGSRLVGTTSERTFTVTNTGGSPLSITKSKPPGQGAGFVAATALPEATVLAPGASTTQTVLFTPSVPGARTDTWVLNGSDGGGERAVTFTGTGVTGTALAGPQGGTWTRNGAATAIDAGVELTGLGGNAAGSSFAPQPVTASSVLVAFDAFTGFGTGADGMTLALADPAAGATPTALGAGGSGLGFAGIRGVAVGMDTFQNAGDLSANAVGITYGPSGGEPLHWLTTTAAIPTWRNSWRHVVVSVVGGYVTVRIDGSLVLRQAGVAVPSRFLLGFTGGSGGLTDLHRVRNVAITYA
jgi:hypothetical protein